MTNPTPHGQVPEALIDLIDAYAETRHRCGGIYNAKTEAARNAVIEALSGVQALSAAPNGWESVIDEARSGLQDSEPSAFDNSGYRAFAETVLDAVEEGLSALAASPTPPAERQIKKPNVVLELPDGDDRVAKVFFSEMKGNTLHLCITVTEQAAPKAEPVKACVCGEPQASGTVHRVDGPCYVAAPQQEAQEPHGWLYEWTHSSATGKPDATYTAFTTDEAHASKHDNCRAIYTAPQTAPAPLSDDVVKDAARWRWLSEHIGVAWNEGKFTSLVRIVSDKNRTALNASLDRMMKGDWSDASLATQKGNP